jgi:hypothetical protein
MDAQSKRLGRKELYVEDKIVENKKTFKAVKNSIFH